jgi:HEAT repeat protein
MGAKDIIADITSLDERIAELRAALDELPTAELERALEEQLREVLGATGEDDPLPLPLVRLVDITCGLDQGAAEILTVALDSPNPDVRQLAGEALLTLTEEGLEAIMPAVEHALRQGGTAAEEMPFILAMIDDAAAPRVIERFLDDEDPEVVASAIEALADVGDRDSSNRLEQLLTDERRVSLDGGQGEASVALGELAREALEAIAMDEED